MTPLITEANKTGKEHAAYMFYAYDVIGIRLGIRQFNSPNNILSRVDYSIDYETNYYEDVVKYALNELKVNPPKWL